MLKKLRIKFVVINMSIVTIMLGIIFYMLFFSTSRTLELESIQMMEKLSMNPQKITLGVQEEKPDLAIRLPYFTVLHNRAGEIIEIGGDYYDLSDTEMIESIVQLSKDMHTDIGTLNDYNLRFMRTQTPMGECYVYSDITNEQSILKGMGRAFLAIGLVAFLVFLGISIFLAMWAVKPVEKAWKQQKQFVADASHELKTPLTVIMTDAELMNTPDCEEGERIQLTESILTMSAQMRGLVESLLELARIDNGIMKNKMTPTDFSEITSNACMMFEPLFFENDRVLDYDVDPDIQVKGSDAHLKQLVDILLDNACKYSSPNGMTVAQLKKIQSKRCLLTVSSQGEALNEEDLKNIFKRFYRLDKARTMNHSYGLGLSIAQNIVKEHRGKIWAESHSGQNIFYVELPLK